MPKLGEVFGIATSVPRYTYVDRANLDRKFFYLLSQDRHLVIHGASKQGKTVLRKKSLPDEHCIVVQCSANSGRNQLYLEMLRKLHVEIPDTISKSLTFGGEVAGSASLEAKIPVFVSGKTNVEAKLKAEHSTETLLRPIGIEPGSIGFISEAIKKSEKRVVIEDFHYLSEQEKSNLAFDLKAFWDNGVFFTIIGIWAEQNLLTYYNGDLSGRVEEIDIQWTQAELSQVLEYGEGALNITFTLPIKQAILEDANQNVGLLQRIAEKYCYEGGIFETCSSKLVTGDSTTLDRCRITICGEEAARYKLFDDVVSRGLRDSGRSELKVYQKIVKVIAEASDKDLRDGINHAEIFDRIQQYEPKIRRSDLTAALNRLDRLQEDRRVSPIVISYNNSTRKIHLVDKEFLFYRKYGNPSWSWGEDEDAEK